MVKLSPCTSHAPTQYVRGKLEGLGDELCKCSGCNRSPRDEVCKWSGCNRSLEMKCANGSVATARSFTRAYIFHTRFPTSSSNGSRLSDPIQGIHFSHARERLYIKTARQGAPRLPISHDLHHDLISLCSELHLYCDELYLPNGVTCFNLKSNAFGSSLLLKSVSTTKYSQNPVTTWPWTNASPLSQRAASSSTSQYRAHLCCKGTWGEGCTHSAVVTAATVCRGRDVHIVRL